VAGEWCNGASAEDRVGFLRNASQWVYNAATSKDRPGDLDYYVGYLVTRCYYKNARDKRQAVYDILNIPDARAFLEKSGYASPRKADENEMPPQISLKLI
jgi:hypothetical protein